MWMSFPRTTIPMWRLIFAHSIRLRKRFDIAKTRLCALPFLTLQVLNFDSRRSLSESTVENASEWVYSASHGCLLSCSHFSNERTSWTRRRRNVQTLAGNFVNDHLFSLAISSLKLYNLCLSLKCRSPKEGIVTVCPFLARWSQHNSCALLSLDGCLLSTVSSWESTFLLATQNLLSLWSRIFNCVILCWKKCRQMVWLVDARQLASFHWQLDNSSAHFSTKHF